MPNNSFEQAKVAYRGQELRLVQHVLPNGKFQRNEYVSLNPTRHDRHLGGFRINTRTGKWADFATGDKGGDLISPWAYVRGISQRQALRKINDFLKTKGTLLCQHTT